MATVAQRTQVVEDRLDHLETVLARFIGRTDTSSSRLEDIVERLAQEAARDREQAALAREEAARFREEDRAAAERDREQAARDRGWR